LFLLHNALPHLRNDSFRNKQDKQLVTMNDRVVVWSPSDASLYAKGTVSKSDWNEKDKKQIQVLMTGNGALQSCHRHLVVRANEEGQVVDDLTSLAFLDEANLLSALSQRYTQNLIYTYMSNILIAVNPYRELPLYNIERFRTTSRSKDPHVFGIAQQALDQMNRIDSRTLQYQPQSIVCCGESGSGKTVSTKQIMKYLCGEQSTPSHTSITEQVLDANPILEAFGNAQTLRNHNSSRFAKFIKMYFRDKKVMAAFTETYLLERSRLVNVPKGERNFHVFYYLAASKFVQQAFHYLGSAASSLPLASEHFTDLEQRLKHFGFQSNELEQLWNICGGILFLGNIGNAVVSPSHEEFSLDAKSLMSAKEVARLWGLDPLVLRKYLESRNLYVRKEVVQMKMSTHEALVNRDAMSKILYVKLFQWLVDRINQTLFGKDKSIAESQQWIGILDVFGFESFETNSFEQFCINLANEKLQYFFNQYVLESEQSEYLHEGILWQPRDIQDNSDTVQLLEGKPSGILSLIDSVCIMPKGTAEILVDNVYSIHGKHSKLLRDKKKPSRLHFLVKHYAATVNYDTSLFMQKNNDCFNTDIVQLFQSSKSSIIRELFPPTPATENLPTSRFVSVGRIFQQQLTSLMSTLQSTTPYFVRCINPNAHQRANDFDWRYIQPQIHFGGLVQAVEMLKFGYPFRLPYTYITAPLLPRLSQHIPYPLTSAVHARNICEGLLHHLHRHIPKDQLHYQLGISKIFFRSGQQHLVDEIAALSKRDMPLEMGQAIHTWIKKRRLGRMRRGVETVVYLQRRLEGVRVRYRWRRMVKVVAVIAKTFFRSLHRVRKAARKWSVNRHRRSASPTMSVPDIDDAIETASTVTVIGPEQRQIESSLRDMERESQRLRQEADQLRQEQIRIQQQAQEAAQKRENAYVESEKQWKGLLNKTQQEWEHKYQDIFEQQQCHLAELAEKETEWATVLQQKTQQVDLKNKMLSELEVKQKSLEDVVKEREREVAEHKKQLEQIRLQHSNLQESLLHLRDEAQQSIRHKEEELKQHKESLLQSYRKESLEVRTAFETQLTQTQQIGFQYEKMLQSKDRTIEQLKQQIKRMEIDIQTRWKQFQESVQSTYERRIRQLEKTVKRQQSQIVKLTLQ